MRKLGLRLGLVLTVATVVVDLAPGGEAHAQGAYFERLPVGALRAATPSDRITGEAGEMSITATACPGLPVETARRRIVDLAVQEWAFFGFSITDGIQPRGNT